MAKLTYGVVQEVEKPTRNIVQENYYKAVASTANLLFADVKTIQNVLRKPIDEAQTSKLYCSLILPIFAIEKQDIGSIYDVLSNSSQILSKLLDLVRTNHSISKSYLAAITNSPQKLSFSQENLTSIEKGVKALYGTTPKSMSVQLNLFINPFHGCLNQPTPVLLLITDYLDQEYAAYKAGRIKELLQRATLLGSKYNYYKILILNVFEKNDLLYHQDLPEVRETVELASALYTNIGYEGKLAYVCKLYSKPSSDSKIICKLGITSYKTVDLVIYLKGTILDFIKFYASKGEWSSPYRNSVEGYTDKTFLCNVLEPFCKNKSKSEKDELLKETLGICFEAINNSILSQPKPDPSCSILFAKHNKQLMKEILALHPEYLVSPFITKSINRSIGQDRVNALQPRADALQLNIVEKTSKDTEFFQFVDDVPTLCPFNNDDIDEAQVLVMLQNTQTKLREISAKIRDDGYILKMIPPEFSTIKDAANIMRLIIKKYLSKLTKDLGRGEGDCTSLGILVALEDQFTESIIGANDTEEGLVFD